MNDLRVLRDRQAASLAMIDRAQAGGPSAGAARIALSVFDGGNLPTSGDHFALGHPVDFSCPETETTPCPPTVDTNTVVPFVPLRNPVQVGDIVAATSVGGRWVAEKGGCTPKVCVSVLCPGAPSMPIYGATVNVLQGGATIATCTTGADGCCTLAGLASGTYTVQVVYNGSVQYSASRTIGCATTGILLGSGAGLVCCGGFAIPTNLTGTDNEGSFAFVYNPNYGFPLWTGGHSVQRLSSSVTTPNNVCLVAAASNGPVRACYQMICHAGQDPTFSVQRSWSWVYEQGTLTPIWYQDDSGFAPGQLCITAPPPICGNPLTDTASFAANPASTNPFVLTGTPVPAGSNATADPLGGSVTFSA